MSQPCCLYVCVMYLVSVCIMVLYYDYRLFAIFIADIIVFNSISAADI